MPVSIPGSQCFSEMGQGSEGSVTSDYFARPLTFNTNIIRYYQPQAKGTIHAVFSPEI